MSTFYASIQGNRGEATRGGSYSSGIRASVQSWDGSVVTKLRYREDELIVEIGIENGSKSDAYPTWIGTIDQLRELLNRDWRERRGL